MRPTPAAHERYASDYYPFLTQAQCDGAMGLLGAGPPEYDPAGFTPEHRRKTAGERLLRPFSLMASAAGYVALGLLLLIVAILIPAALLMELRRREPHAPLPEYLDF
jgi:hypothetical protein